MSKLGNLALCVCASLLAVACGGLGRLPTSFSQFDLGRLEAGVPTPGVIPAHIEVRAPSWLDSSAMQYRLAYSEPRRRRAYAQSRWVAEPAEMLGLALDRALRDPAARGGQCRLRVRLDEFIQVFEQTDRSKAEVRARVELLPQRGDTAIAQGDFAIDAPAPTPDAAGGVVAHRAAVQRLAEEIAGWLTALDRAQGEGLNTAARCRS